MSDRLLVVRLDLETARLSPTTRPLKLAALALDVGLAALEGSTKVTDGLADVTLAAEEDSVGAGGGANGELVQGQSLTAGRSDTLTGRGRETQSGNRQLGHLGETLVVEDRTDNDDGLGAVGVGALGLLDDTGERDGRAVDLGHEQTTEDDAVELGLGPAREEAVKLDEQEQVRVLRLGGLTVALLDVVPADVDTQR